MRSYLLRKNTPPKQEQTYDSANKKDKVCTLMYSDSLKKKFVTIHKVHLRSKKAKHVFKNKRK